MRKMASTTCVYKIVLVVGIFELILAVGIFVCGLVNNNKKSRLYKIQHGLWGGSYLTFNALFAMMAGIFKSSSARYAHMILSIFGFVFLLPGVSTIFAIEMLNDSFYSYWTDDKSCYDCYIMNNFHSRPDNTTQSTRSERVYSCGSSFTSAICHPNITAVKMEFSAICMACLSFILLIITSASACCLIYRCCGVRNTISPDTDLTEYSTRSAPYSQPGL